MKSFFPSLLLPLPLFCLVLLITCTPYVLFGTSATFLVHDHLDSNVAWAQMLAAEGKLFRPGSEIVEGILGGIERSYLPSPGKLYFWLYAVFDAFHAIVAAEIITRTVAFFGLYVLLTQFVVDRDTDQKTGRAIAGVVSLWFALLAFWPPGGISVAGIPMFFWAAFKVRRDGFRGRSAAVVSVATVLYLIYGSLITSGFFALVFTTAVILKDAMMGQWRQAWRLTAYNFVVSILFLCQDIHLLRAMSSDVATSRDEVSVGAIDPADFWQIVWDNFVNGQYHASAGVEWPVIVAIVLAFALVTASFARSKALCDLTRHEGRTLAVVIIALGFTALMYGASDLPTVRSYAAKLNLWSFNFSRFHWLQPGLWAVAFASALLILSKATMPKDTVVQDDRAATFFWNKARGKHASFLVALPFILAFSQVLIAITNMHSYQSFDAKRHSTFEAFYDPELFGRIGLDAGTGARFGVIGLHPAVAQVNGLPTVGGYLAVYPLSKKHAFRKIIAAELEKNPTLRFYFDNWGSRAYLFANDLIACRFMCWADVAPAEIEVALDTEAFRAFGGTHLISVSELKNAGQLNLTPVARYLSNTSEGQRWRLFLFQVN